MSRIAAIAFVLLASAGALDAQVRPVTFGIGGGVSIPSGDEFSEEAETGFHVMGSVGFTPAMLPVGVRADVLFQRFPSTEEGSFTQIGGLANAIVGVTGPLYVIGGIGALRQETPEIDHGDHAHEGETSTDFAWAAGAGFTVPGLPLRPVLEGRYLGAGEHKAIMIGVGFRF